jgi:hypothetical protein
MVIDEGSKIGFFRMVTLRAAVKLEVAGMRRNGKSACSIARQEFGLKSTKKRDVLEELSALIEAKRVT